MKVLKKLIMKGIKDFRYYFIMVQNFSCVDKKKKYVEGRMRSEKKFNACCKKYETSNNLRNLESI